MGYIKTAAQTYFSNALEYFWATVTVYKRVSESSTTYDADMRPVDTSTAYGTGTMHSACVSPDPELVQLWSKEEGYGKKVMEGIRLHMKQDVDIEANDVVLYKGKRYFVRYQPGVEDGYQEVLIIRTEGQTNDGA